MDSIRSAVRSVVHVLAKALNRASGGRIRPNTITLVGFLAHIGIAYLIATGGLRQAGILLVVFGLFDTLDGELARLQNRASPAGMVLDSVTDRVKETLLYIAAAYLFVKVDEPYFAVWATAACGSALLVSYTNAWGEAVMAHESKTGHNTNKTFRNGLMSFDVRMFVLVIGLVANGLEAAIVLIAVLSAMTALQRLFAIIRRLQRNA